MTSAKEPKGAKERSANFTVKLTTLSIVLLCVAVSSLAALVVVATITKADALSTVALALAVLAFAAQLIVTIAQSQTSAEQTRDTFRINAETKAVLAEIQAQGNALVALQSSQFDKVLDRAINADTVRAALSNTSDDTDGDGEPDNGVATVDAAALASELRVAVDQAVAEASRRTNPPPLARPNAEQMRDIARRYAMLSADARDLLSELGRRERSGKRTGLRPDSARRPAVEELEATRFMLPEPRDEVTSLTLSRAGKQVAEALVPESEWTTSWAVMLRKYLRDATRPVDEGTIDE